MSLFSIIRVKSLASGWSGQNEDICPSMTRCCENVFMVAKRYILLDVAKKHILIGCKKAKKYWLRKGSIVKIQYNPKNL